MVTIKVAHNIFLPLFFGTKSRDYAEANVSLVKLPLGQYSPLLGCQEGDAWILISTKQSVS